MDRSFDLAATRSFCLEQGLDPSVIDGETEIELITDQLTHDATVSSQINALQIKGVGRFGNAVLSVTYALSIAKRLGVNLIYIPAWKYAAPLFTVGNVKFVKDQNVIGNVLAARFFRIGTIERLLDVPNKTDAWKRYIGDALPLFGVEPSLIEPSPVNTVHVHIRSGDIFERDVPHPGYGQPPLSFYKKALEEQRDCDVVLVFENYSNPVIRPLILWLMLRKRSFRIQSASLLEDQIELFRARSIVASKGSFLYPVFLASINLRSVTIFDGRVPRAAFQEHISVTNISDKKGQYRERVLAHWSNSSEQRKMMRRYPATNLGEDT